MNPRIVAISGPLEGQEFPIVEEINIGRGSRNDLNLNDSLVAPRHCCITFYDGRSTLIALEGKYGTFVNGFCVSGKVLGHYDRMRVGRSMFVYLIEDECDESVLQRTQLERDWDWSLEHAPAYQAATSIALTTFLNTTAAINAIDDPDEIQSRVFDWVFRVIPVEYGAIRLTGHDQNSFLSTVCRRIGTTSTDPFPIDEEMSLKVLHEGRTAWNDKVLCCPMNALDTKVGVIYTVMDAKGFANVLGVHIRLLEAIASVTAIALKHVQDVAWLEGENQRLNEVINVEHGMIGRSEEMKKVNAFISRIGPTDRPVLIMGPSGTGKELAAFAIHRNSPRAGKPFLAINCANFTASLLQSELFGYEKGAFTGAEAQRKGLFEEADGGSIFLDEIGEFPITMQADLLRVLQEQEIRRVGGTRNIKLNVRIIAATNRNLPEEIKEGRFREDLFYRLNVFPLRMPPLSARIEDIPQLAAHFIKKNRHLRTAGTPEVMGITPEAHRILASYAWPGNIRELESVMEWALSFGESAYIRPEDLREEVRTCLRSEDSADDQSTLYAREVRAFKKSLFRRIIDEEGGNRAAAARRLAFSENHFREMCRHLGLK